MLIDNTRANVFRECPLKYYELFVRNIEPVPFEYGPLDFGNRVHELLEEWYRKVPMFSIHVESTNTDLEIEAQEMLLAYTAHYPNDNFNIISAEYTGVLPLPNSHHQYAFKRDLVVQDGNVIQVFDHKTEKRGGKGNLPQKWAARDQASLYIWAAQQEYPDKDIEFYVNQLTRRSPAGRMAPSFPERQKLERTKEQIDLAVRDITYIADQIEAMAKQFGDEQWPANRENCYTWGYCSFYQPHTYGWSDEILRGKFRPRKEYLQIEEKIE